MKAPQGWQLLILLIAVLLLFGANRLPGAARSLGRSLRIFKSEVKELGKDDDDPDDIRDDRQRDDRAPDARSRDDRYPDERARQRDDVRLDSRDPGTDRPRNVAAPGEARRDG